MLLVRRMQLHFQRSSYHAQPRTRPLRPPSIHHVPANLRTSMPTVCQAPPPSRDHEPRLQPTSPEKSGGRRAGEVFMVFRVLPSDGYIEASQTAAR